VPSWRTWTAPLRCRPRRYERHRPGQLVHVDVKKLGSFADLKRILGPDTPNTLTTRSILATAYQVAGRLDDAQGLRNTGEPGL
jgi:hypothetical protein